MPALSVNLLRRLRLHRGAWLLLVVAMLIKLATGTACLLDGPRLATLPGNDTETVHLVMAAPDAAPGGDDCLLDEANGCHCACAHAVTMPAAGLRLSTVSILPSYHVVSPLAPSLRAPGSPLRPPIA